MNQARLGDLIETVSTWLPSSRPEDSFAYIDLSAVDNETKHVRAATSVLGSEAPSRARQIVCSGDVLVSTVRPNLNAVAVVNPHLNGATASTGFTVLRPNRQLLDSQYLFHWVRTPAFIESMFRQTTGASYPAVSDRIVKNSLIPVPSLPDQKRIAAILDQADTLRAKRRQVLTELELLTQSIYMEMFSPGGTHYTESDRAKLGDILRIKSGTFLPAKSQKPGSHAVYGGNGVTGFHSEYMFEDPVIVIGRVGMNCGAVHLTPPQAWVTDNALYVAEVRQSISNRYLRDSLREARLNRLASRSAQPLISGSRIKDVQILVPSKRVQAEYETRVKMVETQFPKCALSKALLDLFFESLQSRAFRGKL